MHVYSICAFHGVFMCVLQIALEYVYVCAHASSMRKQMCVSSLEQLLSGWGGGAELAVKELSSASVPQDRLQLSPRGHEKQSELSFLSWTYLCL